MKVIPKLSAVIKRYSLLAIATGLVWLVIKPEIFKVYEKCVLGMPNIYALILMTTGALLYLLLVILDLAKSEKGHRVFRALQAGCLAGAILLCTPLIFTTLTSWKTLGHDSSSTLLGIKTLSIVCFFIFLALDLATRGKKEAKSGE